MPGCGRSGFPDSLSVRYPALLSVCPLPARAAYGRTCQASPRSTESARPVRRPFHVGGDGTAMPEGPHLSQMRGSHAL